MSKISLFMKLYRNKKMENLTMGLLFCMLSVAVSMVLFVQENNSILLNKQLDFIGFADRQGLSIAYESVENVLGIIAIAAIVVGFIGGLCLIGFRNRTFTKAMVMMQLHGMQKKDIVLKGGLDSFIYGFFSSLPGCVAGYYLFCHFSVKIINKQNLFGLLSFHALVVYAKTLVVCVFLVLIGNLFMDLSIIEEPVTLFLYNRKGKRNKHFSIYVLIIGIAGIVFLSFSIFHIDKRHLLISGAVIILLMLILFSIFYLFFGVFTKKKRKKMKISSVRDLSFCFICSRNVRDAVLAVTISVGTVILCIAANVLFNVGGMLRSAYRDNMGYTSIVCVDDFHIKDEIGKILENNGVKYTYGFSKLMDYSDLNGMDGESGKFFALIIHSSTDNNPHFSVPRGNFMCESYFENKCRLSMSLPTKIFGGEVSFLDRIKDNQYLSLISYNFIINQEDWRLGIDESFHPVYLIDVPISKENQISGLISGYGCHMESASGLINEIKNGLRKYIDIIAVVAGMIVLVTITVFYTIVQADLVKRRTELYLYRIYGASPVKAQNVIFYEYLTIALITSFAVSFTVMLCGEIYFYFGLNKHFPLSIPVIAATTIFASAFIFICCKITGTMNINSTGIEVIRDE